MTHGLLGEYGTLDHPLDDMGVVFLSIFLKKSTTRYDYESRMTYANEEPL